MRFINHTPVTNKYDSSRTSVLLICGLMLCLFSSASDAQQDFWSSVNSNKILSTTNSFDQLTTQVSGYSQGLNSSLTLTQQLNDLDSVSFRYSQALRQRDFAIGYTDNRLSVSYMRGSGDDFLELAGQYQDIDPYLFHGGWHQEFGYTGYALDYRFSDDSHMQYGQASVSAFGLEDRTAKYLEWSNSSLYARATSFSRGGQNIGQGFDAGYDFGFARVAMQTMDLDFGRSQQRVRVQFDGVNTRQYWIDVASHNNPLYRDSDDTRIMFTFKTLLGVQPRPYVSYAHEGAGTQPNQGKKKKRGWGRAVLIGVGAAAVASASSSGSEQADQQIRSKTQEQAAFEVLNGVNPTSVRENREYGGWVFLNPDGSYSSTAPVAGEAASVNLPSLSVIIPRGSVASATYHTHGAFDPRFDNENFSPTDLRTDRQLGVDGYLATPGGQFKYHNVDDGSVVTLGTIATE